MKSFDLSLYLVTDRSLLHTQSLTEVVAQAIKGGVSMVQLREKDCTTQQFFMQAQALKQLLAPAGIPLIINDRLDIALAVDAEGLHIGQSDLPWQDARRLLGSDKILGLSVENLQQAQEANSAAIDYIGLSPVFATPTKTDTNIPLGIEGIKQIAQISRHPMVAIGGINLNNVQSIINAGAHGVAVVSAIISSPNPQQAAQQLQQLVSSALNKRCV